MSSLAELLRQLGSDASLADEYIRDPVGVMDRAGLNEDEAQAMLARDVEEIKRLSGLEEVKSNGTIRAYD